MLDFEDENDMIIHAWCSHRCCSSMPDATLVIGEDIVILTFLRAVKVFLLFSFDEVHHCDDDNGGNEEPDSYVTRYGRDQSVCTAGVAAPPLRLPCTLRCSIKVTML